MSADRLRPEVNLLTAFSLTIAGTSRDWLATGTRDHLCGPLNRRRLTRDGLTTRSVLMGLLRTLSALERISRLKPIATNFAATS